MAKCRQKYFLPSIAYWFESIYVYWWGSDNRAEWFCNRLLLIHKRINWNERLPLLHTPILASGKLQSDLTVLRISAFFRLSHTLRFRIARIPSPVGQYQWTWCKIIFTANNQAHTCTHNRSNEFISQREIAILTIRLPHWLCGCWEFSSIFYLNKSISVYI